jgi:hypothetical protein
MAYTSAWNTAVYHPRLKLSFCLEEEYNIMKLLIMQYLQPPMTSSL